MVLPVIILSGWVGRGQGFGRGTEEGLKTHPRPLYSSGLSLGWLPHSWENTVSVLVTCLKQEFIPTFAYRNKHDSAVTYPSNSSHVICKVGRIIAHLNLPEMIPKYTDTRK